MSKERTELKQNQILESQWGYEQTNVIYYQVVRLTKKTAWVQMIVRHEEPENGFMSRKVKPFLVDGKPQPAKYNSEPAPILRRKIQENQFSGGQYIKVNESERAYPWNGIAATATSYG